MAVSACVTYSLKNGDNSIVVYATYYPRFMLTYYPWMAGELIVLELGGVEQLS